MPASDVIKQLVERFELRREVESMDKAIDGLAYELYGLMEKGAKISEEPWIGRHQGDI